MVMPKIFSLFKNKSYVEFFPKITILNRPFNLFLNCYSYDIILPVISKKQSDINIFEETTLKLLHYKSCSIQEVADTLCMDRDLINFIIIRLKELNFLDDKRNVTESGKKLLNYDVKDETEISQVVGKIFVNKENLKILPYIHIGEFKCEDIEDIKGDMLRVSNGSTGNNKTYIGKFLNKKAPKVPPILSKKDILKVLKRYNKICHINPRFEKIDINYDYHIEVSSSEDVAIHLQAVIQDGNVDHIIVSDGFVMNIDFLVDYIKVEYPSIIEKIKEQASRQIINIEDEELIQESFTYDNRYPEIIRLLKRNEICTENADQIKEANEISKKIIVDCFSALEWTLHYHYLANPLNSEMLQIVLSQSKNENRSMLIECLKKVGVKNVKNNEKLISNIDRAKVNDYLKYKEPVLYTLLPLCVLEAVHNQQSNLHHLIRKMPNFLEFLMEINQRSMVLRHSVKNEEHIEYIDYSKEIYKRTLEFISTLIVDFDQQDKIQTVQRNASQQRINAQNNLAIEMGSILFNTLDTGIQDELLRISGDKPSNQLPLPYEYILILSRILETYFYQIIRECKRDIKVEKLDAIKYIESQRGRLLPKSFTTIKDHFYKSALEGKKATLGAYSVVLLRFVDDELVNELLESDFIEVIDEILHLRKHGNRVGLHVQSKELRKLRLEIIDIIKTIGGYYG